MKGGVAILVILFIIRAILSSTDSRHPIHIHLVPINRLLQAVAECGAALIGDRIWRKHKRWPVYSKFFDNMGPIPHHMHQSAKHAALVGQQGKPESYYFPPQLNNVDNNFAYTFMGLEPGTTKAQLKKCLEDECLCRLELDFASESRFFIFNFIYC